MFEVIKKFYNLPKNQILKLRLISHLKNKKIMSQSEIKSLPKEIFTKDLVEKYGKYLEDRLDVPEVFEYFLKNDMIDYIPYKLQTDSQLLTNCIEYKRYDLINDFEEGAFTEDNIKKLSQEYIKSLQNVPIGLRNKSLFLQRCIELKKYELFKYFTGEAFTEDNNKKILQEEKYNKYLIKEEYIRSLQNILDELRSNSLFLQRCIELEKYELIDYFNKEIFTEKNIKKILQEEKYIKNLKRVPFCLRENNLFLHGCIEYKRYDLINDFEEGAFTEDNIRKLSQEYIKNLQNVPIGLRNKSLFLQRCIELKKYELISHFKKEAFTENNIKELSQEYIKSLQNVPIGLRDKSLFLQRCIELEKYDLIKTFDKSLFNKNLINIFSKKLNCSYEEMEYKINYLFNKNNEILSTLDLRLLGKQYNVFDIEFIEKIGNYQFIQEKILKLNEKQLLVFSKISKLLTNNDYDLSYIIVIVLNNLVLYEDLIKSVNETELSDEQLKNLICILKMKNNIYDITNIL